MCQFAPILTQIKRHLKTINRDETRISSPLDPLDALDHLAPIADLAWRFYSQINSSLQRWYLQLSPHLISLLSSQSGHAKLTVYSWSRFCAQLQALVSFGWDRLLLAFCLAGGYHPHPPRIFCLSLWSSRATTLLFCLSSFTLKNSYWKSQAFRLYWENKT